MSTSLASLALLLSVASAPPAPSEPPPATEAAPAEQASATEAAVPMQQTSAMEAAVPTKLAFAAGAMAPAQQASATEAAVPMQQTPAAAAALTQQTTAPEAAASAEQAPASGVVPPQRIDDVAVPYPEAERAAGREGEVVLRLTIDEHGVVTESEVVRSAGPAFDEAIRTASLSFRFEPARVDGEVVACQIELLHTFRLDAAATPPPETKTEAQAPTEPTAEASTPTTEAPDSTEKKPMETKVSGRTEAEQMRQSAEAVKVISTRRAKARSADLGQVLASQEGVEVRRAGGLGSTALFSLNGLTDDQIRFFIDGVPLDLAGYPFGVANVPVNLVDSVQLYRGVVPVRYGADALGGAVNLASAPLEKGLHGAASIQGGAFGTWRLTLGGSYKPEVDGFYARAHFFTDTTDNDYKVDVDVTNDVGTPARVTLPRFHDGYTALGGGVEVGYTGLGWADRIALRAFGSTHDKELQHNLVMSGAPYGEARYGASSLGAQLLYEKALSSTVRLDALAGYGWQETELVDVSDWVYDWYGNQVFLGGSGEITDNEPTDQTLWQRTVYGRANVSWDVAKAHHLRLAVAPTLTLRTGEERELGAMPEDPLSADRSILTFVTGLEYEVDLLDDALEVIVFAKDYVYAGRAQQLSQTGEWRNKDRDLHQLGAGAAMRLRLGEPAYLKASYERATRLPRADEVFGNGILIQENLDLEPEHSHNLNVGVATVPLRTRLGAFRGELNGFARLADNLILLTGRDRDWSYQNVFEARVLGVEGAVGWSSPAGLFSLDVNATYQDSRNVSDQGLFGAFDGRRLPNRPWFFANATARMSLRGLARAEDELSPFWSTRYVDGFFRNWEGLGDVSTKQQIDSQLVQAAGVGYRARMGGLTVGLTAELDNVTNAKVFDFFGVQRPGRAGYLKGTLEY